MGRSSTKLSGEASARLVFFLLLYLYVWLRIEPVLLFYGDGSPSFPVFSFSRSFLLRHLPYPGGPVNYLSALLSQGYRYSWAGAGIITLLAGLLGWAAHRLLSGLAGARVPFGWSVPGLFILFLCSRYTHRLGALVGILLAVLAAGLYRRVARGGRGRRVAAFLVLAVPLYYVTREAYILYALLCAVAELGTKKGSLLSLCYVVLAAVLPLGLCLYVLRLSLADAYLGLEPFHPKTGSDGKTAMVVLSLLLVGGGLGAVLWRRVRRRAERGSGAADEPAERGSSEATHDGEPTGARQAPAPAATRPRSARLRRLLSRPAFELELLLLGSVLVAALSHDSSLAKLHQLNRYGCQAEWDQVLVEAADLDRSNATFRASHLVTRALYETGRLPYEMFSYPQHPGGYMLGWGMPSRQLEALRQRMGPAGLGGGPNPDFADWEWYRLRIYYYLAFGDLCLQLGLVNEAEREACELLELFGEHPAVLKRLALVSIAKGQTAKAKVFLHALSGYLHHGDYAREALQSLEENQAWSDARKIEHVRSVMLDNDTLFTPFLEDKFERLLHRNSRNRMAYEYQMAFYLLNLLLADFVEGLGDLDRFGYPGIPRHYEEAILIYQDTSGRKVELPGREISVESLRAYHEFKRRAAPYLRMGSPEAAQQALGPSFGHTYFYYFFLGV